MDFPGIVGEGATEVRGEKIEEGMEIAAPGTSVLYRVVQQNPDTFLAFARGQGRVVPRFVERELRAYVACEILAHGIVDSTTRGSQTGSRGTTTHLPPPGLTAWMADVTAL